LRNFSTLESSINRGKSESYAFRVHDHYAFLASHESFSRLLLIRRKGEASFAIWELLIFMAMGCIGGCLGALFNQASEYLTKWRMRNVNHSKYLRSLEALCVSIVVSFAFYFVPYLWGTCTQLPSSDEMKDWSEQEKHLVTALVPFKCQAGKEYNQVASLIFTDADTTIKQLLHSRDDTPHGFTTGALFVYFITYFVMATLAFGIAVPAGLFIPALLSGAGFGRFCGHILHVLSPGKFANEGIYALIGAAAMLGGKARMTISLTVILLEASGDMEFVLPLMFTLMCARFTGNIFNEGIYELGIHLKHIPFLEPEIPKVVDKQDLTVRQVMCSDVKVVRLVERAGVVYDLLKSCAHSTFPIVDMSNSRILYGTVSRDVLCTLLLRKAFGDFDDPGIAIGPKRLSPLVQWATIQRAYPKYPTIEDVDLLTAERNRVLDLRPYANSAPYTIHETASIQRTYTLFRTLGLRFLCVIDNNNQVVGMVTRKDLLADALEESLMKGKFEDKVPVDHVVS
jgi:chloride channel 7